MAAMGQARHAGGARRTPRLAMALALIVALGLVGFGLYAASRGWPRPAAPRLVSMADSAQAMQRAGETMRTHGQAMVDEARRMGDQELLAHGDHWLGDGQPLLQGARWMAIDPTAPGSTVSAPAELAAEGTLGALNRGAWAMLHDPSGAREVDLEALRWNGLSMRDEGRNMVEHGRVMAEEAGVMVARHGLAGPAAADLAATAATMQTIGGRLRQNGQAMVDYADQLRRAMALR